MTLGHYIGLAKAPGAPSRATRRWFIVRTSRIAHSRELADSAAINEAFADVVAV